MGRRASLLAIAVAAVMPNLVFAQTTSFSGRAAYYDPNYKGRTASGQPYDAAKFTAAHKTLPFGTRLKVTDRRTGRHVIVVINDRGPFTPGRVIDLSLAAAKSLDMLKRGIILVDAVHTSE